jgi:hypothetical protein
LFEILIVGLALVQCSANFLSRDRRDTPTMEKENFEIFCILVFLPLNLDIHVIKTGRRTCGPEIFLCSPNWFQSLKENRYFDRFSLGF